MEVQVKPTVVLRDFEADARVILEGKGMHLTRDGRWKHFGPDRVADLTWGDIRAFLEANYPARCPMEPCRMPGHPDFFEEWRFYFDSCRKNIREQRSGGTLYRGDDATVGYAEVPGKLLRALQNDFPEDFGGIGGECLVEPTDLLRALERSSALNFFVLNPTRMAKP